MKTSKKQGISLIVLVITIIIMIILAAAIILSLNSSGIIGKASEAKNKSNTATIEEALQVIYADAMLGNTENPLETTQDIIDRLVEDGVVKEGELVEEAPMVIGYANSSNNERYVINDIVSAHAQATNNSSANTTVGKTTTVNDEKAGTIDKISYDTSSESEREVFVEATGTYNNTVVGTDAKKVTIVADEGTTFEKSVYIQNGSTASEVILFRWN